MPDKNHDRPLTDEILTAGRVADILEVTQKSVEKEIRENRLPGYKRLNRWYVFRSDLNAYIESGLRPEDSEG